MKQAPAARVQGQSRASLSGRWLALIFLKDAKHDSREREIISARDETHPPIFFAARTSARGVIGPREHKKAARLSPGSLNTDV
ncbi:MAG: hypothetical protein ABIZ04_02935 [Opitutus sp.]